MLFSSLLLSICFVYCVGNIIYTLFIEELFEGFKRIFIKLFSGLFFVVTLFSLIVTKGVTINILIVVLVLILFLRAGVWKKWNYSRLWKDLFSDKVELLMTLVPLCIFFIWRYYTLYSTTTDIPVVINMDSLKHVIRAGFLVSTGIESVNVNYINLPSGVDPYHYFEAWSIGLFGSLFKINFWITEQVIVYPLYSTFIVVGFWGIIEKWQPKWYIYTLGLGVVCNTGLYFEEVEALKFFKYTGGFAINAFDEWKGFTLSVAYMVTLLFFNLLDSTANPVKAILILLILPIVSITLGPAILGIVTSILILLFLFKRRLSVDIQIGDIALPFLVALLLFGFYKFFGAPQSYIEKPNVIDGVRKIMTFSALRTRSIIIAEKIIQAIIFYSPVLLISLSYLVFEHKNLRQKILASIHIQIVLYIVFVGWFMALGCWMLFYGSFGSSQYLFYTMAPFVNIVMLSITLFCVHKSRHKIFNLGSSLLITLLMVFFCYRTNNIYQKGRVALFDKYSIEYIDQVISELEKLQTKNGFKIESADRFVKYNDHHHLVGSFIPGAFDDVNMYSITLGFMFVDSINTSRKSKMLLRYAGLSSYINYLNKPDKKVTIDRAIVDLIEKHNFSFVIVDKWSLLPDYLKKRIEMKIVDEKSNETFYLFKNLK